jgi:hypothetical protein
MNKEERLREQERRNKELATFSIIVRFSLGAFLGFGAMTSLMIH